MTKSKKVMTKSFSLRKYRAKRLHNEVVSLSNTYIHTYINRKTQSEKYVITQSYTVHKPHTGGYCKQNQYTLLNLSTGDKQNDVVIVNPKQQGKHENKYSPTLMCRFMIHMCTHIYIYSTYILTKYRARKSFMTRSFIFNTQNKSFHDRIISLVQ